MTWCPSVTPRSGRWGSAMPGCRPGRLAGLGGAAGGRADSVDGAGHCGAVEGRAPGLLCFKVVFLKDSQKGRCFKHVDGLHVLSRKPAPFPALCLATQRGAAPGASPGPSRPLRRVLVWAAGAGVGGGHRAVCGRRSRPASAGPDPARAQVQGSTSDASCAGAAAASRGRSPVARGGGLPRPLGRSVWARTPGGLARPSCGSDSREASGRARPPLTARAGAQSRPELCRRAPGRASRVAIGMSLSGRRVGGLAAPHGASRQTQQGPARHAEGAPRAASLEPQRGPRPGSCCLENGGENRALPKAPDPSRARAPHAWAVGRRGRGPPGLGPGRSGSFPGSTCARPRVSTSARRAGAGGSRPRLGAAREP